MSPAPTCDIMAYPPPPLLPRPDIPPGYPHPQFHPHHAPHFGGHFPGLGGLGPTNSFSTPSGAWLLVNMFTKDSINNCTKSS